jgi:vesicle-associated membrane protein 7
MTILYSLIARGQTVLVEFTENKGNFIQISRQILEKIPSNNTKVSYQYDNYMFHIQVDKGFTYFCMSEKDFGNRIPFLFLDDIRQRFYSAYGEKAKTALALSLNRDFSRVVQTQMV